MAKRTKLWRGGSRQPPLRFWPEQGRRSRLARTAVAVRPFVLLAILLAIWPTLDARLVEPPSFLATEPEPVSKTFARCGRGADTGGCVVDGDTFRIGHRRIRIIGIDTPEKEARCTAEAKAAEAAAARLQALLNERPFELVGRIDQPTDRYGRELKSVRRLLVDGSHQSVAAILRREGHARRYLGGFRSGWC